jgi:hypothetical protein
MTPPPASIDAPLMTYCVLHQPATPNGRKAYEETVAALHTALLDESRAMDSARAQERAEVIGQTAQQLRGHLIEFLSMPISSDSAEVARIVRETLESVARDAGTQVPMGVISSTEGMFVPPPAGISPKPKILGAARYLSGLGFATTAKAPPIYESVYQLRGGINLDVIETIIRDRLGVYRSPHGDHIATRPRSAIGVYNHVASTGSSDRAEYSDAVFWFSKPAMQYDPFRAALAAIADEMQSHAFVLATSIWQRKLGLGPGREFIFRCSLSDAAAFKKLLVLLKSLKGERAVLEEIRSKSVCALKRPVRQD